MNWVKLRSWHLQRPLEVEKALCGKVLPPSAPWSATLPANEKSCERCLQLNASAEEKAK
jgi:hypothetical protein